METAPAAKRQKLINNDPFQGLPAELWDLIIKELNFDDIMKASLVSRNWYTILGQSKLAMEKIRLIRQEFSLDDLQHTRRNYVHFDFSERNLSYYRPVFKKIFSSVRELEISHDIIGFHIDYPNLQSLVYYGNDNPMRNGIIDRCRDQIKHLTLTYMNDGWMNVLRIFKNLETLKVINLDVKYNPKYTDQSQKIPLKKFTVQEEYGSGYAITYINHCRETLEHIDYRCDAADVPTILTNVKNLKFLGTIMKYKESLNKNFKHMNVKKLEIDHYCELSPELLMHLPNLETVEVVRFNKYYHKEDCGNKLFRRICDKFRISCETYPQLNSRINIIQMVGLECSEHDFDEYSTDANDSDSEDSDSENSDSEDRYSENSDSEDNV